MALPYGEDGGIGGVLERVIGFPDKASSVRGLPYTRSEDGELRTPRTLDFIVISGVSSPPATAALLQQTRTIPIIFANAADPIGSGLVASLPRPGGNVTGFTNMEPTMTGKWLELLKEIAPRVNRVAFLFNPATAPYAEYWLSPFKAAAASIGVEAIAAPVRDTARIRHCRTGTPAEWWPDRDAG